MDKTSNQMAGTARKKECWQAKKKMGRRHNKGGWKGLDECRHRQRQKARDRGDFYPKGT